MCGITGAVGFIDDKIKFSVDLMNKSQVHRGPDGEGFWSNVSQGCTSENGVVLAHRRLSIIDLSNAGIQPMHDKVSGSVLVYNGEIYNYKFIRNGLEKKGFSFFSDCDTEVLLKSLVDDGIQSLKLCNGMFAFAFWNSSEKVLTLGRDRLGIKPLYYTTIDQGCGRATVLFASELKTLLASRLVERHIDPTALETYLWNGFVSGPRAFVNGVKLLDAGSTLSVKAGGKLSIPVRYWDFPNGEGVTSNLEEVAHEFEGAVSRRLISDVPLGIFLSGGIDSSAIAAAATQTSNNVIHTFNIGFPDVEFDESRYAKDVASQLHTNHTCLELTESEFLLGLPKALTVLDQPTFDCINTYFVSKAVREAGITVALAGTGGDEIFGGYASFVDLPIACKISNLLRFAPDMFLRAVACLVTRFKTGSYGVIPPQTRWGKIGDMLLARGDLLKSYQVSYSLYTQSFQEQLKTIPQQGTYFGLQAEVFSQLCLMPNNQDILSQISCLELNNFICQRLLRDTDVASMAVSLEARVPFLDHQFLDAVSRLPVKARYQPLSKKQAIRNIALSTLNAKTFDRPKTGFVLPFEVWLRKGYKNEVRNTLFDTELCNNIGLNPDTVKTVWTAFDQQSPGMYWSRVWALYILLYWCRKHRVTIS